MEISKKATRRTRTPKRIGAIGMTRAEYFELKIYIKGIVLPGTPAFNFKRFEDTENKEIYRQWLHKVLEEIGPKFFPSGGKGFVWPRDYTKIYKAVNYVVRALSAGIRKDYNKGELRALPRETGDDETQMVQDDGLHGDAADDVVDAEEGVMILGEDEVYAVREQAEEKMMAAVMAKGQENKGGDGAEEGMEAEPIELEDLLGLMKPELFAHFPDLAEEYFDWDEIVDINSPEPIARLLLLLP